VARKHSKKTNAATAKPGKMKNKLILRAGVAPGGNSYHHLLRCPDSWRFAILNSPPVTGW
jgi:hypothetical protein